MGYTLDESDTKSVQELLDVIYNSALDDEVTSSALESLKALIENKEASADSDGDNHEQEQGGQDNSQEKISSLKHYILAAKPDLFKYLIAPPEDPNAKESFRVLVSKAELVAEMLRDSPPCKLAFIPCIDELFQYTFRLDQETGTTFNGRDRLFSHSIGELLRPDPEADDAHQATLEALSNQVKALSDHIPSDLSASAITEEFAKKQRALACGLQYLTGVPLKPDATPAFIEVGGLDALLGVIARGPLPPLPAEESPNESLEHACFGLSNLMESSSSKALADALVQRQAVVPLITHISFICLLEGVYRASDVPRALLALTKWNETLRKQIFAEAETLFASNPEDLAPGAAVVLWELTRGAETYNIDEINKFTESENWVTFFLTLCEPGADENIMRIASNALSVRIRRQGHQLHKALSTSEMMGRFVNLLAFYCTQEDPEISRPILVLQQLVSPAAEENAGKVAPSDEEPERAKKTFCRMFGQAIKARCQAPQALVSMSFANKEKEEVVQEPSVEGLANVENVKMLKVLVGDQYTAIALLAEGLLDYQKYLLSSRSALTRRAGLELLTALCRDLSLMKDFKYISDTIDAFKTIVVHMLDDSRALIRALALKWLSGIMEYWPLEGDCLVQYKPGVDFAMESVSEEKLVAMLRGAELEVGVAAEMIELMTKYSTGWGVRDRLKNNDKLVEILWNGVFWDSERAHPNEDEDISEGVRVYVNIENSSGEALTNILDPLVDHTGITSHVLPRLEQLKDKEPTEFAGFLEKLPGIASLVALAPETGVLSRLSKIIANEEQLPCAIGALRGLSQGSMLAKVSLGQSEDIYPALVKVLKEGTENSKSTVLADLEVIMYASTVSRTRFMKEGGIKALLDIVYSIVPSDYSRLPQGTMSTLVSFLTNFPEGAQSMINAGAIPILESKKDNNDISDQVGSVLSLLEEYRTAPAVERFEFTTEPYTAFGKGTPDAAALERLKKNLESSQDEKQLAIVGGLPAVLTDLVSSSSEPKSLLQVLQTLLVVNDLPWQGHVVALRAAERCGLWEALMRFVESDDKEVSDLAVSIQRAIVPGRNEEL